MDVCEHLIKYIFTAKFARENSQLTNVAKASDFRRVVHGDCKVTQISKKASIFESSTRMCAPS